MPNLRMREKLKDGRCLDVTTIGSEVESGIFELREFEDDVDYCVAPTEQWIWSIGKRKSDGKVLASVDTRFYQHPDFECLWLR